MKKTTVIVLAMHGAPPRDFPRRLMAEFFDLHSRGHHAGVAHSHESAERHRELEHQMRRWPRTPANDPFHAASVEMAEALSREIGQPVILGFNEFCAPDMDEALDEAVHAGATRVVVITPMMTRGGEHAEVELPATIARARERHAGVHFEFAWPFDTADIARFLASQISRSDTPGEGLTA
jgi:sirohydrochlorin cobaltochelatase